MPFPENGPPIGIPMILLGGSLIQKGPELAKPTLGKALILISIDSELNQPLESV